MKNIKRILTLVLALVFVLAFAACGNNGGDDDDPIGVIDDDEDIQEVGGDWRTWQAYEGGTLGLDGYNVDVLMEISATGAVMYYDDASGPDIFATVEFPYATCDLDYTIYNYQFADVTGDSITDFVVNLVNEDGNIDEIIYEWDEATMSFICDWSGENGESNITDFTNVYIDGSWECSEYGVGYEFYGDSTFAYASSDGTVSTSGYYEYFDDHSGLFLYAEDGSDFDTISFVDENTFDDESGCFFTRVDELSFDYIDVEGHATNEIDSYMGSWEFFADTCGVVLYDDGAWEMVNQDGLFAYGTWEWYVDRMILYTDTGSDYTTLQMDENGCLIDSEGAELFSTNEFSF